jgi:hypothetical protein
MSEQTKPAGGISRRTVTKGVAWSVPVVIVASAAPAMAASGGPPRIVKGPACKNPGNSCRSRPKGYGFNAQVCNDSTKAIYLYSATISSPQIADLTFGTVEPGFPIQVPAGQCVNVLFNASSDNSANLAFTATVTVQWGHNPTPPDPDNHPAIVIVYDVTGTPPNCPCP